MSNIDKPPAADGPAIVPDEVSHRCSREISNSIASSTTSIASSILQARIENGRTYHKYKDGQYAYPNDEKESDRLDLQHNLFLLTTGFRLGLAPPADPESSVKRVLDIGTGIGLWAIEFGDEHPEAEVLGVDLSPVQTSFIPPNVKFEIDDLEEPWRFNEPFDYIHNRTMTSSISDWDRFLKQCCDHLERGGWLEVQDGHIRLESDDGTLTPENAFSRWIDKLEEACNILGRPFVNCPELVKVIKKAGFVDITMTKFKWPTNSWPMDPHHKELGIWTGENLLAGVEALTLGPFTRALEWMPEECQVLMTDVRKEFKDRSIHAYFPI
ncbi:methyltransferase domain-containing protein [Colletotrichum musicola]|uniref:Methyltransferase domain-containing protein n=1 Tax=Colletotrichum musicola TaxID=2175873 RepID=A0A8H6U7F1_9PEZI|nr:methyltransferase domain-containing protein [Colletotrichum musicola]